MRKLAASIVIAFAALAGGVGIRAVTAESPGSAMPHQIPVTREAVAGETGLDLRGGWRFRPGDDASWADPSTDDANWEPIDSPRMAPGSALPTSWSGIGWFRIRLDVDESVVGTALAVVLDHPGASEVFLDGKLLGGFGTVAASGHDESTYSPSGLPLAVAFDRGGEHVLAVRYSCTSGVDGWMPRILSTGFAVRLRDAGTAVGDHSRNLTLNLGINAVLATMMLGFGVLHLMLFTFQRSQRANLYYGLFGTFFGLLITTGLARPVFHVGYEGSLVLVIAGRILVACVFLCLVAFLRSAFAFPFMWWYRALVAVWVVAVIASLAFPTVTLAFYGINVAISLSIGAAMQTIGAALWKRLDGAWIIGLGAYCIAIALTAQLVAQIFGVQSFWPQAIAIAGFLGLPICVSVFFARHVARTNRALESKLAEVEQLSAQTLEHERQAAELRIQREQERAHVALLRADNDRKAKELEEARQLQLSMLPSSLPVVPGIEIAAYMKPATEVGGDYYDFHVGPDGTLTIAVGDATGHGLKAGTLVTATKGLFNAFALEPDIVATFHRSSLALKQLNLRYLYMALTLAKVNGNKIRVGAAGMPPMLVWRAATGEVEEIALPGLPLGGAARFPYQEREVTLADGDTVVLMSDGFPERFNEGGEMIDYARARDVLSEAAGEAPQAIIERFVAEGDAWAGIRPQDDDITFVVLRFGQATPTV
ncbi:MAG: SpoIIE family protein phosphatase [Blastocatellia bacterium]|jgi:serine phosphatase RsbU (regulator of sigma subunit)|nr:SpoIIE family protein phosphatase [Blastocatellia bacterium]MBK6425503.1 SpoIIE family protein phosphatase [Blastocatellia bacterium]